MRRKTSAFLRGSGRADELLVARQRRELESVVERAVISSEGDELQLRSRFW